MLSLPEFVPIISGVWAFSFGLASVGSGSCTLLQDRGLLLMI